MFYLGMNKWFCSLYNSTSSNKFKTVQGRTVERIDHDSFIVRHSVFFWLYIDLVSTGYSWQKGATYFRDCVGSRGRVELLYGRILIPEEEEATG